MSLPIFLIAKKQKLKAKNVSILSYDSKDLKSSIFFGQGELFSTGIFRATNGVKSLKFKTGDLSSLFSDKATIQFLTDDISDLFLNPAYSKITVEENVRLELSGLTIYGDLAYFDNAEKMLYSSEPVKIKGVGRVIESKDGFVYNIQEGRLKMVGRVEGVLESL